jgi:hypothetical protein
VSWTPRLTWDEALKQVNSKFLEEQYHGSSENLKPVTNQNTVGKAEVLALKGKEVIIGFSKLCVSAFQIILCVLFR